MNRAVDEPQHLVRSLKWDRAHASRERLLELEWIVTNALGGYASGTVAGPVTRRYHGLLIAAHRAPLGRVVMLTALDERLRLPDGREAAFARETHERADLAGG